MSLPEINITGMRVGYYYGNSWVEFCSFSK